MSHAIQNVAFAVNNLFQQKHSKVIKPTELLKSSIKSTVKPASLFTYKNAISATFNMLVNQKHHSTFGSIHRKDVKNPNVIPAFKYFNKNDMILTIIANSLSKWN